MTFFSYFHLYGFLLACGGLAGLWVVYRQSKFFGMDPAWIDKFIPIMLVCIIIGARLYHLITDWRLYVNASFFDLIAIWRGGVGFFGAIIGGAIGLLLVVRYFDRPKSSSAWLHQVMTYTDLLVFGIPLAQAIGRLGNLVNQELYGLPTTLPWGIIINGQRYHPLFLYEALLNLVLFFTLIVFSRKHRFKLGQGTYTGVYLIGYGLIRFSLEFLRIETARFNGAFGIISIAQWVALGTIFLGLCLLFFRNCVTYKSNRKSLK